MPREASAFDKRAKIEETVSSDFIYIYNVTLSPHYFTHSTSVNTRVLSNPILQAPGDRGLKRLAEIMILEAKIADVCNDES